MNIKNEDGWDSKNCTCSWSKKLTCRQNCIYTPNKLTGYNQLIPVILYEIKLIYFITIPVISAIQVLQVCNRTNRHLNDLLIIKLMKYGIQMHWHRTTFLLQVISRASKLIAFCDKVNKKWCVWYFPLMNQYIHENIIQATIYLNRFLAKTNVTFIDILELLLWPNCRWM